MIEVEKIALIIIFLIILVVCVYVLVGFVKPNGDIINLQNQIRQCCSTYRAYSNDNGICPDPSTITCGSSGSNLEDLINEASMTPDQLKLFCGCPT
jgi:hypothetical protein